MKDGNKDQLFNHFNQAFSQAMIPTCEPPIDEHYVGSMVEWLKVLMTNMVSVQNPLAPFCCVLGKDTLRHIPLLVGLGKQF